LALPPGELGARGLDSFSDRINPGEEGPGVTGLLSGPSSFFGTSLSLSIRRD